MKYVSKYAYKPETVSQSYQEALSDFCMHLPLDLPAENAVQRLFARMAADRDISAQEAVHLLLTDKFVGCTRITLTDLCYSVNRVNLMMTTQYLKTTFLQTMKDGLMNKAF
jgi:hypothetical protein